MSDFGQQYHTPGYKCIGTAPNIEHDNVGINHTFREVNKGAPIKWSEQVGDSVEIQSTQIGNPQPIITYTTNPPDHLADCDDPDDVMEDSGESRDGRRKEPKKQEVVKPVKVAPVDQDKQGDNATAVDKVFQGTGLPAALGYRTHDVCTEQLTRLINDVFDGQDSSKSLLAYCLDAQRAQWKYAIRHPGQ